MAGQPAVNVGAFFKMTRDTLVHVPGFMRQALRFPHLTVTFLTGNFFINMALVIKQHVFGHIIYFYPWCRCIGVEVFVFLFYPGVVGNNIVVAVQAFFHRRDSGMIGIGHEGVAVLTLDLLDPAVDSMAEWNRLLRSDVAIRKLVKKESKYRNRQHGDQSGQDDN